MSRRTAEWLEGRFREWQKSVPRKVDSKGRKRRKDGVSDFARYIGVTRNTMNNWLLRDETPGIESADKIAAKLGPDIYELIASSQHDPLLASVVALWGKLTYEQQKEITAEVQQFAGSGASRGGEKVLAETQLP